jgi:uncharacterized protein
MKGDPFIVDAHTHFGYCSNFYMPDVTPERMIETMDLCRIKRICASHIAGLYSHNLEYAYEDTVKAIEKYPGRLYAYAIYDPFLPEESLRMLDRYLPEKSFVGVKIHPAMHEYPIDGERYAPLWEYAAGKRFVILSHTWDPTPQNTYPYEVVPAQEYAQARLFDGIAEKHRNITFILGHGGGHYYGQLQAIDMAKKHENVFLDISGEAKGFGVVAWLVRELGARRILYASDMNWLDPRGHIGRVLGADVTDGDKQRILYKNADEIFQFL